MFQNWVTQISPHLKKIAKNLPDYSFGKQILLYDAEIPNLKHIKVAILGINGNEADKIREQLYPMSYPFLNIVVADLGNIRNAGHGSLISLLKELLRSNIIPIIIGGSDDDVSAQFLSYQETRTIADAVSVASNLRLDVEHVGYTKMLNPKHNMLFHFGLIGLQSHIVSTETLYLLEKNQFEVLRLGKTRQAIEEVEPMIRDADMVAFHLNAIRQADAPGQLAPSASGFYCEEACLVCRYAGMSDKLSSFGLYGLQSRSDLNGITINVSAQLVWYFIDGLYQRKSDYPVSTQDMTEYIVDFREHDYQLVFWKSNKSSRWWVQPPTDVKKKYQRHKLIACTIQDYQMACRSELSDRLLLAFHRFGQL